jgi:hypothetical protein
LTYSCKKDTDDNDELIWPEPYVPEWLVSFMGVYTGTWYGDDEDIRVNWIGRVLY